MTEEAPYRLISEVVTVDGKQVITFTLGKYGKELLNRIPELTPETRTTYILERLISLEDAVEKELLPFVAANLLNYLKENPDITTIQFHKHVNDSNSFLARVNWAAKTQLEKENAIESISQGKGKPRKWRVKV